MTGVVKLLLNTRPVVETRIDRRTRGDLVLTLNPCVVSSTRAVIPTNQIIARAVVLTGI